MSINFPTNPSLNQQYTYETKTWEWNGVFWGVYSAQSAFISSLVSVGTGSTVVYDVSGGTGFLYSINGIGDISVFTSGQTLYISGGTGLNISGIPQDGYVITSDAFGNASWQPPPITQFERLYDSNLGYLYCGVAPYGSTQADNTWKITRIFVNNDGSVTTDIANNVDWINRYTHIYT